MLLSNTALPPHSLSSPTLTISAPTPTPVSLLSAQHSPAPRVTRHYSLLLTSLSILCLPTWTSDHTESDTYLSRGAAPARNPLDRHATPTRSRSKIVFAGYFCGTHRDAHTEAIAISFSQNSFRGTHRDPHTDAQQYRLRKIVFAPLSDPMQTYCKLVASIKSEYSDSASTILSVQTALLNLPPL